MPEVPHLFSKLTAVRERMGGGQCEVSVCWGKVEEMGQRQGENRRNDP